MKQLTLSTGIVVTVRPLNPFFGTDASIALRRKYPRPQPPLQEVEGLEGKKTFEPNRANPDYLRELSEYNRMINTRAFEWSLEEACEVEIDEGKLVALKAKYESRGMELPETDKLAYITRVAIGSSDDLNMVRDAIQELALPTEDAIREKADGYKS